MTQLQEQSYWRDTFQDQLSVAYKGTLFNQVLQDNTKFDQAGDMIDKMVGKQFDVITKQKDQIKAAMVAKNARREKSRAIESADRRIVHFIFDPQQPIQMTPFTQKFSQLMEGAAVLKEAEEDFQRACDDYVEKIENENLDPEQDVWPVKYDETKFYELELKDLQRLSFAVADNPFVKADIEKFYPEIHVISGEGKVLATINPTLKSDD